MKHPNLTARHVGLIMLVVISTAIVWIWAPAGDATSDSASYLDGARHLAAARGFVSAQVRIGATAPRPIVDFPPGFSLLMVPGIWIGLDVQRSAAVVVGVSYVVYCVATYLLLLEASGGRWPRLALLFVAVLMLRPGVLMTLDTIGSELPGAAFWMVAVYLGFRLLTRPTPDLRRSVAIGILLGCAFLTRWSALYLVIPFALGMFLASAPRWSRWQRLRCTLVVLVVPLSVAGPWIVRNYLTTRTLFGYRRIHFADPLAVAADALRGLGAGPFTVPENSLAWARLGVMTMLALLALFVIARRRAWRHGPVRLALVSALGYGALLVLSASTSPIDPLRSPRFWLPVWPLLAPRPLRRRVAIGRQKRQGPAAGPRPPSFLGAANSAANSERVADARTAPFRRRARPNRPRSNTRGATTASRCLQRPARRAGEYGVPLVHELPQSAEQLTRCCAATRRHSALHRNDDAEDRSAATRVSADAEHAPARGTVDEDRGRSGGRGLGLAVGFSR
jgi:4-amino-4-deoxy-L-arabinose transferase-like glycosyltransferase